MSYVIDADYKSQWLFPPSLEDLLPADHPARLVREFVDALNLTDLGFDTRVAETGRPTYAASLMLKVILYGYMNRVRSTRGWERLCYNDIGALWLTGRNFPDHVSFWRCWNDNRKALKKLLGQLLQIAAKADLVGMVLHAVDGTKILSQAAERHAWRRAPLEEKLQQIDKAITEIMEQTANAAEGGEEFRLPEQLQEKQQLKELIQKQLSELERKDRDNLNPQDPEARVMKCGARKQFAYNAQAVVDEKSGLVTAAEVVVDESDNYQLVPMLDQVKENLGGVAEQTVADAGYMAVTQLAEAEEKGYPAVVNLPESLKPQADAPYQATQFVYDAEKDQCICPQGKALPFEQMKARGKVQPYEVRVYRCTSYESCSVRWECSSSKKGRTVQIHPNHDVLLRQRARQEDPQIRALLKRRGAIVEGVFGWIKHNMGFWRWAFRGLDKVRTQWSVLCTALNLSRLYKSWQEGTLSFA